MLNTHSTRGILEQSALSEATKESRGVGDDPGGKKPQQSSGWKN